MEIPMRIPVLPDWLTNPKPIDFGMYGRPKGE